MKLNMVTLHEAFLLFYMKQYFTWSSIWLHYMKLNMVTLH